METNYFPIRCYSCNKCIAHLYPKYHKYIMEGLGEVKALQNINITKICCMRMFKGFLHNELYD